MNGAGLATSYSRVTSVAFMRAIRMKIREAHRLLRRGAAGMVALAALTFLATSMPARAQAPEPLFTAAPPPSDAIVKQLSEPQVTRLGFALADVDLIGGPEQPAGAEELLLNLFDDVQLVAIRERLERRSPGSYTWFGHLTDDRQSSVILVVRDSLLTGYVLSIHKIYDVVALDDDRRSAIREIDQSRYRPDEPPIEPGAAGRDAGGGRPRPPHRTRPAVGRLLRAADAAAVCGADDFIDVMVVYTADADAAPGDILGEIQAAIDDSNQSYANSGITQRLRLVHAEQVAYAESGAAQTDRDRLQNPGDGFIDGVHALRNTYGADIVSLWTEASDACGMAFIMGTVAVTFEDHAFNVVTHSCAVGNHSFAHECGHNMSARHDRSVDGTNGSPFSYNHGFVNIAKGWRTVMAYNDACVAAGTSCTRLQFWSNPDITFGGDPMGIADGDPAAADNRTTLNNTRTTVQQFRAAHAPVADAGPDKTAECGKPTTLDGSASCDPDGDPLTYAWTGGFNEGGGNATGVMPMVTFPKGIHPVTLVVSDGLINSIPDTVNVDATADLTPPNIVCPASITVECSQHGGTPASHPAIAAFLAGASATDLCDPSPSVSNNAPSFFNLGMTTVTFTGRDAAGRTSTCNANVHVVDTTPPVVPADTTIECTSPLGSTAPFGIPTDICDPDVAAISTNNAPPVLPFGSTTVTWMAKDHSGNMAVPPNDKQIVTVVDTTPPMLSISVSPDILWPPNHTLRNVHVSVTVSDVCDASPTVRLVSITSSEPDSGTGPLDKPNDIQGASFGTDDRFFRLRAEHGPGAARTYTITYSATDKSGQSTTQSAIVRVPKSRAELVSRDGVRANGASVAVAVNTDGRSVAFPADATNLVSGALGGDTNAVRDVFLRSRNTCVTDIVSTDTANGPANGASHAQGHAPAVSGNGLLVAFYSDASDLVAGRHQRPDRRVRPRPQHGCDRACQCRDRQRRGERTVALPQHQRGWPLRGLPVLGVEPRLRGHQWSRRHLSARSHDADDHTHLRRSASERRKFHTGHQSGRHLRCLRVSSDEPGCERRHQRRHRRLRLQPANRQHRPGERQHRRGAGEWRQHPAGDQSRRRCGSVQVAGQQPGSRRPQWHRRRVRH